MPVEVGQRQAGAARSSATSTCARRPRIEVLAKLPTAFDKDGFVTAGNASGIVDGAAMMVLTTARARRREGRQSRSGGSSPGRSSASTRSRMGIGPAPAIRAALEQAGMKLADLDLIEINEAFAGQILARHPELELDLDKLNVNGGAIALGHPLGATGTRITLTLLKELRPPRRRSRRRLGLHRRRPGHRHDRGGRRLIDLAGRRVLVTGGSRGIGAACCRLFAARRGDGGGPLRASGETRAEALLAELPDAAAGGHLRLRRGPRRAGGRSTGSSSGSSASGAASTAW